MEKVETVENNKDKYLETRKMLGRLCIRPNVKQKKYICNEKSAEKGSAI